MTETLGARLRAQTQRREAGGLSAAQRSHAALPAKVRQERERQIAGFLSDVLSGTQARIEADEPMKWLRFPREIERLGGDARAVLPDDPTYALAQTVKEFSDMVALKHELRFVFRKQHDGGGVEEWHEVKMEPVELGV